MKIMRFDQEAWFEVAVMDLTETDLIYYQRNLYEVTGKPTFIDGKVHISACQCQKKDEPIVLAVGGEWSNRQATSVVMDYTNSACRDFGDGTYMIAELEEGPGAIYSPRLPSQQLEDWCMDNMHRFKKFFEVNQLAINRGEIVRMEPWWGI